MKPSACIQAQVVFITVAKERSLSPYKSICMKLALFVSTIGWTKNTTECFDDRYKGLIPDLIKIR